MIARTSLRASIALLGATLSLAATHAVSAAGRQDRSPQDTGSPEVFAADLERTFRQAQARARSTTASPSPINLVFHVLSGAAHEGDLSDAVLAEQVAQVNAAYQSTGLHFNIADVRRYPDSTYFAGGCFPTTEKGLQMKAELAVDPAHFVNVYTCKLLLPYIAGYGTLPDEFPEADHRHGVVVDYGTFPGSAAPLNLGHTLIHELGHYFGLLHTFQGACAEPGDNVADTPAESAPAYGCPIGRDTCPQTGADPVSNFMDYSDDACTDHFTPLQSARMEALIAAYRPTLTNAAFAIGAGMTGNWYDPSQIGHGFSIEVLTNHRMLADWYVFGPNGGPIWIVATGTISGDTAVLEAYWKVGPGGRFPPHFDATQMQNERWGTLTFTFTDCNNGRASWEPSLVGYTRGSMPITRLTTPAGLTCP